MRSRLRPFGWMFGLVRLSFASILFITSLTPSWVLAQSSDDSWVEPLNLSHSGFSRNPDIVADSGGGVHVVWQDENANFIYSRLDGGQWSAPEATHLNNLFHMPAPDEPPDPLQLANYTGPNPLFIASPLERIVAFWINPEGRVFASSVANENFKDNLSWGSGRLVASGAASFAAAVDARGDSHVAFLRPEGDSSNPPGIYYTHSKSNSWTTPVLLYDSPYFPRVGRGEANLSLATTGTEDAVQVYVAWDNRPRKQILLAQSTDGGDTWGQPVVIAGPEPGSGSSGPFNIQIGATQKSVLLVWQSGQPGSICSQLYQFSSNGGAKWSRPQLMVDDLLGCAQSNEFVPRLASSPESPLYFLAEAKSQVFLTAWHNLEWSQPQAQPLLSGFEEPEIYTQVIFGCRRSAFSEKRLYVVGCDQGQGGDVWVTSRDLGTNLSLEPPVWSPLSPVSSDQLALEAVEMVATEDSSIHAFFSQHGDTVIYYTRWDGESWSRKAPVLKLPDGEAGPPAIAAGPGNQLFLIAPNKRGTLYFSRAISSYALLQSSWSPPKRLAVPQDGTIGSVDIAWDALGSVYVAYSVSVGEGRGVYLVHSKDGGTTWSEPIQVFDGAAEGFDFIGVPALQISDTGVVHLIWKVQAIQGDGVPQPLALYYARSEDGGTTFNPAVPIVDEPVAWREIVMDSKGNLHLLWQPLASPTTLWDQISLDDGRTWQYPEGLPDAGKLAAVTTDSDKRLHLVGVGSASLGHWIWDSNGWRSEATLHWSSTSQREASAQYLAVAVNNQGKMVVLLAEPTDEGDVTQLTLLYADRVVELSRKQTSTQDVSTKTPLPPTLTPIPPTPEPSSTPTSAIDEQPTNTENETDGNTTNDPAFPFTMALVPVALLLFIVLGIVVRRATRGGDR